MKALKTLALSAAAILLALSMTSCGNYVGKEKSHPLFVKAGNCVESGNYSDAAKNFEEFLAICPKSPLAHYKLASVYADYLDQPIKAIYHYEKYIELSPPGTPDVEDVKVFIKKAKESAMQKLNEEFKVTPETERLARELATTREKLGKYVDYSAKLKSQNDLMRQRLLGKGGTSARGSGNDSTGGTATRSPGNDSTGSATSIKPKVETYKVKSGDTLAKISREVYGSSNHYNVIFEVNKDKLASPTSLKVGQELKIPQLPPPGAR